MSIFDNPNFLDELLKIAQTAPSGRQQRIQQEQAQSPQELDRLTQQALQSAQEGQQTAQDIKNPIADYSNDPIMSKIYQNGQEPKALAVANALLVDLQRKLDPDNAPKQESLLSSNTGQPVEMKKEDLRTLGDFVRWAASQGIMYKNQLIASSQPQGDDYIIYNALPYDRSDRDAANQPVKEEFYVSKSLITPVLEYLRDSDQAHQDKVFQVMLGGMIRDANSFFARAGLKTIDERRKKDEAPEGLDPTEVIDGFVSPSLKSGDPLEGLNNAPFLTEPQIPLRVRDLLSYQALRTWLTRMSSFYNGEEKPVIGTPQEPGDECKAVHILYQRANRLTASFKNGEVDDKKPGYSQAVAFYLKQIQNLGSKFTDASGQACAVTSFGNVTTPKDRTQVEKEDKDGKRESGGQGGKSDGDFRNKINEVCQLFPLRVEDISLTRISKFFTAYTEIVSPDRQAQLSGAFQKFSQAQSNLQATLSNRAQDMFSLSVNTDTIMRSWLKPPQGNHVVNCLEALQAIVDASEESMRIFKSQYADDATRRVLQDDQFNALQFQIGESTSSIAQRNKIALESLENSFISRNRRS